MIGADTAKPLGMHATGAHLDAVAVVIAGAVRSPDPMVDRTCNHLVRAGGKGLRPLVSVLAAAAVGEVNPRTHAAAAACELLHLSTLHHDDVIDDAGLRRGAPSVNRAWGERVAVLSGNRLTALALEVAGRAGDTVTTVLAATYLRLVEGERREVQLIGCTDHSLDDYLEVIDGKTASLIAAAARVGAVSAGAQPDDIDGLEAWGGALGRAYQLADDLLDLTATSDTTGKPTAHDVRQGVFTLPLLDALGCEEGGRIRQLLDGGAPYPPAAVDEVIGLVHHSGAIERAAARVDEQLRHADSHLASLPVSDAREALQALTRSVVPATYQRSDPSGATRGASTGATPTAGTKPTAGAVPVVDTTHHGATVPTCEPEPA